MCISQHRRLGAASPVAWLDDQTLAIVDEVLGRRMFDVRLRTKLGALVRGEEKEGEEDFVVGM